MNMRDIPGETNVLGLDPNGRVMSLLWASPALIFALFPLTFAVQRDLTSFWGAGLALLTLGMIVAYVAVWLINPTPAESSSFTPRFTLSHGALFTVTCVLIWWSIEMDNNGTMLNMLAYSYAAWILQSPKRATIIGLGVALAGYGAIQWFFLPDAGFPYGVFMVTVTTSLSRLAIEVEERKKAQQQHMLTLAQEQERLRIGADLHDILGHSLTAIVMKAQVADKLLAAERTEEARQQVSDLLELSRASLAEVRAVVANMRSLNLDNELTHATTLLESAGIHVALDNQGAPPPGPSTNAFARILREATTNILAHSSAKHVEISLSPTSLVIRNDGYSARLADKTRGSATGLQGLREAIETLGSLSWGSEGVHWVIRADLSPSTLLSPESHPEAAPEPHSEPLPNPDFPSADTSPSLVAEGALSPITPTPDEEPRP